VFKLAIADKNGEMELTLNDTNRTMHSLIIGEKTEENKHVVKDQDLIIKAKGYEKTEKVKTVRFDTFFKQNKINQVDFCKFDVEGAEDMILRSESFINIADKIKAIEVEFHFPTFPSLIEHMQKLGYNARRFDCSAVIVLFWR
jgi:FkbM family methyltransferase